MRVTEQIDALYTLATNPVKYLVVPRFLASASCFHSHHLADVIGILGDTSSASSPRRKTDSVRAENLELFGV